MVHSNAADLLPWRAHVAAIAMSQCPKEWDTTGPMFVRASFYLPRPKNHYRANGELKDAAPWWCAKKPDTDKLCRSLLDALTDAGVWADDSQAVQLNADKTYTDTGPGGLWCIVQHLTERNNG